MKHQECNTILDSKKVLSLPNPCYVLEENLLRRNLSLIKSVTQETGAEVILAFKSYALWRTFPIIREYIKYSTASSIYEAQLAFEEMGEKAHTFSPAYTKEDFESILKYSSHISFNSLSQIEQFKAEVLKNNDVSFGIRINPEYSVVETELYNPCAKGSRFGVTKEELKNGLPQGIEGLHFHVLCEGEAEQLEDVLKLIEENFNLALKQAKWLNMGGGHLMTHEDYKVKHLIKVLKSFKERNPHLQLILEPGSAFAWQTGYLSSKVVDIVEHHGIKTAIVNVSFTCHMPDCLEMPYHPRIRGAKQHDNYKPKGNSYRIGGNSCLSGDWMGYWEFDEPLKVGDTLIFEDMLHYTTVKTNMFNGIPHPSIAIKRLSGDLELLRSYSYEDYKYRMD